MKIRTLPAMLLMFIAGCTHLPKGIEPVTPFLLESYLGKWYEIARLDHSFERGLSNVTATYSLSSNGDVKVINRGFSAGEGIWKTAEGRARFVGPPDKGHLKVSFFGPFYSSYVIFSLDDTYSYALVCGFNKEYLWLLARTTNPDPQVVAALIGKAASLGFATDELIMVNHDR